MHFTHLDLGFGFLEFFGVFENWWVFCKIFGLGVVFLMVYDHALHPICIFTMFHAFKCVFICCMLIGLDWVEPMMQIFFFLHVTCSCTFHAYVLFFFWVLCCDGAFLFLYVSLSLSDSLRMAPKHKSAPSRNPLRFEASSFNPTLLHIWFCDKKAQ